MKSIRHSIIKDIVENAVIETQEDLASALRQQHIMVTQATVSRDIKELMLIKIPIGDGRYRYAFPSESSITFTQDRMARLFQDSVVGIDYSENIIVLKTLPGAANAVASALDYAKWQEVIGTVAGDDNILVVIKPKTAVLRVIKKMEMMVEVKANA